MKPNNLAIITLLLDAGADPVGCFDTCPPDATELLEKYRVNLHCNS